MSGRLESLDTESVRGYLHRPESTSAGCLALTHGAGGDCDAAVLVDSARSWCEFGFTVLRFDLEFRRRKPKGPPHPSGAEADRASVAAAAEFARDEIGGLLLLGGHSYGGRQASMVLAEHPSLADGLILLSYPLHPPGKPEKARTAHLPELRTPTLFVHGTKDPFGSPSEVAAAIALVGARTETLEIAGAGHDLSAAKFGVADATRERASTFFGLTPEQ